MGWSLGRFEMGLAYERGDELAGFSRFGRQLRGVAGREAFHDQGTARESTAAEAGEQFREIDLSRAGRQHDVFRRAIIFHTQAKHQAGCRRGIVHRVDFTV